MSLIDILNITIINNDYEIINTYNYNSEYLEDDFISLIHYSLFIIKKQIKNIDEYLKIKEIIIHKKNTNDLFILNNASYDNNIINVNIFYQTDKLKNTYKISYRVDEILNKQNFFCGKIQCALYNFK